MNENDIKLVKDSFSKVAPIAPQAAALFYGRLFELDPSLKALFPSDLTEQGKKLMTMLGVAVGGLSRLETIVGAVQQLGVRHVAYGIKEEQYDTVGSALIWTLEKGLGEAFTAEVRNAWIKVYTLLATTMKDAARQAAQAA